MPDVVVLGPVVRQHLDRDRRVELLVVGQPDGGETAGADAPSDGVAAEAAGRADTRALSVTCAWGRIGGMTECIGERADAGRDRRPGAPRPGRRPGRAGAAARRDPAARAERLPRGAAVHPGRRGRLPGGAAQHRDQDRVLGRPRPVHHLDARGRGELRAVDVPPDEEPGGRQRRASTTDERRTRAPPASSPAPASTCSRRWRHWSATTRSTSSRCCCATSTACPTTRSPSRSARRSARSRRRSTTVASWPARCSRGSDMKRPLVAARRGCAGAGRLLRRRPDPQREHGARRRSDPTGAVRGRRAGGPAGPADRGSRRSR